ncbi:uncharacterized protein METZ01_LOCUS482086 [marine metagenome]|uniref:Uncharacterized protein n=1 Tax=marine metagenome TaxID=408172 RepID=A0A383CAK8_9ZZZZ
MLRPLSFVMTDGDDPDDLQRSNQRLEDEYPLCKCPVVDNENCKKKVLGYYDDVTVYEEICKTCNKLSHHSADGYYEEKEGASASGDLKKQINKLQRGRPESTKLGMDSYGDFVFCAVKKWVGSEQRLEMILIQKGNPKTAADIFSEMEESRARSHKDSRDPDIQASHNQVKEAILRSEGEQRPD